MIQKLRLQHGWSQEHLAELTGVSVRTIQRLEQGKPASPPTLKLLGAVFNVPFHELKHNDIRTTEAAMLQSEARHDVRKWRGFYFHVAQYAVVMSCLAIFNYWTYTNTKVVWVIWSALGWGLAVVFHYLGITQSFTSVGVAWRKRKVDRLLTK